MKKRNKNNGAKGINLKEMKDIQEWENKTYTLEQMKRILFTFFGEEATIANYHHTIIVYYDDCVITVEKINGKWAATSCRALLNKEKKDYAPISVAQKLLEVSQFVAIAFVILVGYKYGESTNDYPQMIKFRNALLELGLNEEEIIKFNWFTPKNEKNNYRRLYHENN